MRTFCAAVLATSMIASTAFAATVAPLAPGKPAGVKKAQAEGTGLMWGMGVALVAGGAILIGTGNGKNTVATSTTGTP